MPVDRLSRASAGAIVRRTGPCTLLALAAVLLGGITSARASVIMEITNSSAGAGGTGSFDVALSDTGGTLQVGGFSAELSVPGASGVKFTGVNTSTAAATPYIFGTLQTPPLSFDTFPNTSFTASDTDATAPGFVTLNPGDLVGLAHVSYSVAAGTAPGPVTVSFVGPGTSLSDVNGGAIAFTTTNGTITVAQAVPEPSSLLLASIGGGAAMLFGLWRRRANRTSPTPAP